MGALLLDHISTRAIDTMGDLRTMFATLVVLATLRPIATVLLVSVSRVGG
ncbi:hypothetical protein OESDEN_02770 [Oesophagostomum dentatum]|uniref:Uncharacterized protein n=1 Tax=Oesophagostomum dentatum TaxID=61180 RepID=A0A0B1TI80_OESDE|nr:hypothetical protein OESDEN_02770 [Oesophagostomum dentatum]